MARGASSRRSKRSKSKSVRRSSRRKALSSRRTPKTPRKQGRTKSTLSLRRTLIPHHRVVEMPYTQMVTYAADGTDARHTQQFRMNSIYDPFYPAAPTHQPYMHDQAALQYHKYTVIGCSLRWTIIGTEQTTPFLFYSHFPQQGEDNTLPGVKAVFERRTDVLRRMVPFNSTGSAGGAKKAVTGTLKYNANKYWRSNFKSQELQKTDFGANPTGAEEVVASFCLQNINNGSTVLTVKFDLVYRVLLDERIDIPRS